LFHASAQIDYLRGYLADPFLPKVQIPLDPQPKPALVGFQFVKGKVAPFVTPVSEYRHIPKERSVLGVVLGGVPGPRSRGIEKLGDDEGILNVLLRKSLS